jgi:succinyl-CoA synthetase beta subunit
MNLHEFQAKAVLAKFGVALPRGKVAHNASEAEAAANDLGGDLWVVKAQAHTGGRGKAGGIKVCRSPAEVAAATEALIGTKLVTHQTGPAGKPVHAVYVEEGSAIARELYVAMLVDRGTGRVAVIASTEGGMDIEEVAAKTPDKILTIAIDPAAGLQAHHARRIAFALGLKGDLVKQAGTVVRGLHDAFNASDASLLEINPLAVTEAGDLKVLDCKFNLDDNALFRHADLAAMRDEAQEDPTELEAAKVGLNYITLDGNIGCMVNGAGLAMATMDICKLAGGEPANFLDVGGGATKEQVAAAFKIIVSDPHVKAILVNIFGGIMRCDVIAESIVAAARDLDLKVPVVARLEGTNVEQGKAILAQSGLAITAADDLSDAAAKAVAAIKGAA